MSSGSFSYYFLNLSLFFSHSAFLLFYLLVQNFKPKYFHFFTFCIRNKIFSYFSFQSIKQLFLMGLKQAILCALFCFISISLKLFTYCYQPLLYLFINNFFVSLNFFPTLILSIYFSLHLSLSFSVASILPTTLLAFQLFSSSMVSSVFLLFFMPYHTRYTFCCCSYQPIYL